MIKQVLLCSVALTASAIPHSPLVAQEQTPAPAPGIISDQVVSELEAYMEAAVKFNHFVGTVGNRLTGFGDRNLNVF